MGEETVKAIQEEKAWNPHAIRVLLVDDQRIIGETVRRMLADQSDIEFTHCDDPAQAIKQATEFKPTVILQDLVMPKIDGLTLVKFYRANPATKRIPLIVLSSKEEPETKAKAFELGANDYMVKLPDKLEILARIRYHSSGYIHLLERDEAYNALLQSRQALAAELSEAAEYVISLLPPEIEEPVKTNWIFIPSSSLGGDTFGYHPLDAEHYAIYLLDVCGHGVGAALLSVSVMNVLRSQSLPNTDFREPDQVLCALNEAFPMEKQGDKFFTMWYGVFHAESRLLKYASGGHPAAILIHGDSESEKKTDLLTTKGMVIGGMPGILFQASSVIVGKENRLFVFSDGVYEIVDQATDEMVEYDDFVKIVGESAGQGSDRLAGIRSRMIELNGSESFEDDFSLVMIRL